ncbi:alpha/beta-hydrolase [Aulographum hederae CBS 113979]|uniref:Carboxylic ester hydrolase n=1 Tax=Aulographum hederae CBS 113979 TaxID=1176131 RepID=A0A6G1H291_9PEZI|nr:alpha/beta-hydrolase [Aulographum hederae CBS 113979]
MHFEFLALTASIISSTLVSAQSASVTLKQGVYVGSTRSFPSSAVQVNQFKRVRYASQPERFGPPKPVAPSSQQFEATGNAPSCPQGALGIQSEDCHFLNLWTPANAGTNSSKAVMVFYYGGGLQVGGIDQGGRYDGANLAANEDIIVITPNYRVNLFGFPGIVQGIPKDGRNPGFLDQHFVLDWIQENIAAFGGDPKRVMISGQSGGGASTSFLLMSSPSPKFHSAVVESGSGYLFASDWSGLENVLTGGAMPARALPDNFKTLAAGINCTTGDETATLDCVKKAPVRALQDASAAAKLQWGPAPDGGITVPDDLDTAHKEGKIAKVPIIAGTTSKEGGLFNIRASITEFGKAVAAGNTTLEQMFADAYTFGTGEKFANEADAKVQVMTDMMFTCLTAHEMELRINGGETSIYRYFFSAPSPPRGPVHGADIPYLFGTASTTDPSSIELTQTIQHAFANFAKDPAAGPGWAKFGATDGMGIAELGGAGNRGGSKEMKVQDVDGRCNMFFPRYERSFVPLKGLV